MKCNKCDKEIKDELKFCPFCGADQTAKSVSKQKKSKEVKQMTVIIIAIISLALIVSIILSAVLSPSRFTAGNTDSSSEKVRSTLIPFFEKDTESKYKQINAFTALDRAIPFVDDSDYCWTYTNGNKYIDSIYLFQENPEEFEQNDKSIYEEKFTIKSLFEFDSSNQQNLLVSQYTRYYEDVSEEVDNYQYIFNEEGNLEVYKKAIEWGAEYDCLLYSFLTYDNDNVVKKSTSDYENDINYESEYNYDEEGFIVSKTEDDNYYEYVYTKDDYGNIDSVNIYKNGEEISYYEYEYENAKLMCEIAYSYSHEERAINYQTEYTYDERGNIINISKSEYNNGEISSVEEKRYKYDENNNVIAGSYDVFETTYYFVVEYCDEKNTYEVYN